MIWILTYFAEVCLEVSLGPEAIDDLIGLESLSMVALLANVD